MNGLKIDLKVCEGCGALWLRTAGLSGVYCSGCAGEMAQFPNPRGRHAGGRRRMLSGQRGGLELLKTKIVRCNGASSGAAQGGVR